MPILLTTMEMMNSAVIDSWFQKDVCHGATIPTSDSGVIHAYVVSVTVLRYSDHQNMAQSDIIDMAWFG